MWTVDLFLDELRVVRQTLGLDRIHLLGQSWGGLLAMEYALTRQDGGVSLTIASSPASMLLWVEEANRLRAELPPMCRRRCSSIKRTAQPTIPHMSKRWRFFTRVTSAESCQILTTLRTHSQSSVSRCTKP